MPVEIHEVSSTVRSVDADALLSPRMMDQIIAAVVRAIHDGGEREKRSQAERRVTSGVSAERDEGQ
jgi:hypothetical protein